MYYRVKICNSSLIQYSSQNNILKQYKKLRVTFQKEQTTIKGLEGAKPSKNQLYMSDVSSITL